MKQKFVIALVLIVAAGLVFGAVKLLNPKPQYVLVPTDSGPGPGGQAGPPANAPAPGSMPAPGPQANQSPAAESGAPTAAQKPSATVSIEGDVKTSVAKQPGSASSKMKAPVANPPGKLGMQTMESGQKNRRKMPSAMRSSFELMRTVMEISRLEESKKDSITSSQAKAILAVINPLRSKKTLNETQAKTAASKLNAILTASQKKAISELPRMGMRRPEGQKGEQQPSGTPPSGDARPSGPPPNMGSRPNMDMNPLSSSSKSPMAERISKMIKALEAKAKG